MEKYRYDAYISYNRRSGVEAVRMLAKELASLGVKLFLDEWHFSAGNNWQEEIISALENSKFIILVFSQTELQSPWVNREHSFAFTIDPSRLIPVVLDQGNLPVIFKQTAYLNMDSSSLGSIIDTAKKIAEKIMSKESSGVMGDDFISTLVDSSQSLPALDYRGFLPEGVYDASLDEIMDRFGKGSEKREFLANELSRLVERARNMNADSLIFGGSFISSDLDPGDMDIVMVIPDEDIPKVSPSDINVVQAYVMNDKSIFLASDDQSVQQWKNFLENKFLGEPRGIINVSLKGGGS